MERSMSIYGLYRPGRALIKVSARWVVFILTQSYVFKILRRQSKEKQISTQCYSRKLIETASTSFVTLTIMLFGPRQPVDNAASPGSRRVELFGVMNSDLGVIHWASHQYLGGISLRIVRGTLSRENGA